MFYCALSGEMPSRLVEELNLFDAYYAFEEVQKDLRASLYISSTKCHV
jgi:hypothetical protein